MNEEPSTPSTFDPISFEQARVLGCLIEKEMTTPENYPLTLNSLVTACNQSSNREPVVSFDEGTVLDALEVLKTRGLAFQVTIPGARVQKFKHNLNGKFPRLEKPGLALLCVLLLRGAQTPGELRQRTERLHGFLDIPSLEAALQELIAYPETPLVVRIPAGGGRKTVTYAHLLCGPVEAGQAPVTIGAAASSRTSVDAGWKERIERELAALREEVAQLRRLLKQDEPNAPPSSDDDSPPALGTFVP
jgi:uncharacterized protein YceH (UPF0502 family)